MFRDAFFIRRWLCCLLTVLCLLFLTPPAHAAEEESEPPINLLLIGQDRLEGETRARSDSMILCSFRTDTKELVLTSFLRDLYVPIPDYGSNRINAAYTFGGIPLLSRTMEENFDISIDGSIEVDFSQFADIVDVLGGVELEIREDEAEIINEETGSNLTAGVQHLNGLQTLSYSRIRRLDPDGDFSRTKRQRTVLNKLLENYRDANFVTVAKLLGKICPMITTDMTTKEILGYAVKLYPMLSELTVSTQRIPADGTYKDQTIDGMCVLVANMDCAKKLLKETTNPG